MKDIWMNNRFSISITIILATLTSVFFLVETFITRFIIQAANEGRVMDGWTITILFLLMALSYLIYFFRLRSANYTDYMIKKDLNKKYWEHLYSKKIKGFNLKREEGESITFFTQKASFIIYEYFGEIYEVLYNSTFVILGTAYILFVNYRVALTSIGFYSVSILLSRYFSEKNRVNMENINNSFSEFMCNVDEIFKNRNQIYCYNVFDVAKQLYIEEQQKYIDAIRNYEYIRQVFNTLNDMLTRYREFVVLIIVIFMSKELVVANLFMLLYLSNALSYPFVNFSEHVNNILSTRTVRKEINDFGKIAENAVKLSEFNSIKEIKIDEITVQKENKQIIKGFSLGLEKGKKYLLRGDSGSGKTTIVKTLLGFEDYQGQIKINDETLKDEEQLYRKYAFITSADALFNDTVKNNITLFAENVNEKRYAQIIEKIVLNLSPELILNNEELNVSGGEKQKILIARSLYNDYEILVIDEALAAIDQKSAEDIVECIVNTEKMVLLIDHNIDFNTASAFDKILNLNA